MAIKSKISSYAPRFSRARGILGSSEKMDNTDSSEHHGRVSSNKRLRKRRVRYTIEAALYKYVESLFKDCGLSLKENLSEFVNNSIERYYVLSELVHQTKRKSYFNLIHDEIDLILFKRELAELRQSDKDFQLWTTSELERRYPGEDLITQRLNELAFKLYLYSELFSVGIERELLKSRLFNDFLKKTKCSERLLINAFCLVLMQKELEKDFKQIGQQAYDSDKQNLDIENSICERKNKKTYTVDEARLIEKAEGQCKDLLFNYYFKMQEEEHEIAFLEINLFHCYPFFKCTDQLQSLLSNESRNIRRNTVRDRYHLIRKEIPLNLESEKRIQRLRRLKGLESEITLFELLMGYWHPDTLRYMISNYLSSSLHLAYDLQIEVPDAKQELVNEIVQDWRQGHSLPPYALKLSESLDLFDNIDKALKH